MVLPGEKTFYPTAVPICTNQVLCGGARGEDTVFSDSGGDGPSSSLVRLSVLGGDGKLREAHVLMAEAWWIKQTVYPSDTELTDLVLGSACEQGHGPGAVPVDGFEIFGRAVAFVEVTLLQTRFGDHLQVGVVEPVAVFVEVANDGKWLPRPPRRTHPGQV